MSISIPQTITPEYIFIKELSLDEKCMCGYLLTLSLENKVKKRKVVVCFLFVLKDKYFFYNYWKPPDDEYDVEYEISRTFCELEGNDGFFKRKFNESSNDRPRFMIFSASSAKCRRPT
mgnify:CR=1 FL=1